MATDLNNGEVSHYTVIRPTNALERMFYLEHRLGAHSNLLFSAHYTGNPEGLTREAVYAAVRSVIESWPELALIGVPEAPKGGRSHVLFSAALREIDLETCVDFRDDEEPVCNAGVVEQLHNEWPWTDQTLSPRQPWWKVVVFGRREVAFVAHHFISDGRFSQTFHKEFLAALNSTPNPPKQSSCIVKIDPARTKLSKEMLEFWTCSISGVWVAHNLLVLLVIRLFFGNKLLFSDVPKIKAPRPKFVLDEAAPEDRVKTRIASVRIPNVQMHRVLAACRAHETTFTPMLIVMLLCTAATDFYPDAKVGLACCALDQRRLFPEDGGKGRIMNGGGTSRTESWLNNYRGVFRPNSNEEGDSKIYNVDVERAWKLVANYRASINKVFEGKNPPLTVLRQANNGVSSDLEGELKSVFPILGLCLNNMLNVSNVGVFKNEGSGPWRIDDTSFSSAAVHGGLSYEVAVHVSGVEGGDTVVNASYQDGQMSGEIIYGILNGALDRMEALVNAETST
ncbi:hypothetical protein ACHAPJ_013100 [Fusarium lateritium]